MHLDGISQISSFKRPHFTSNPKGLDNAEVTTKVVKITIQQPKGELLPKTLTGRWNLVMLKIQTITFHVEIYDQRHCYPWYHCPGPFNTEKVSCHLVGRTTTTAT